MVCFSFPLQWTRRFFFCAIAWSNTTCKSHSNVHPIKAILCLGFFFSFFFLLLLTPPLLIVNEVFLSPVSWFEPWGILTVIYVSIQVKAKQEQLYDWFQGKPAARNKTKEVSQLIQKNSFLWWLPPFLLNHHPSKVSLIAFHYEGQIMG